MPFFKDDELQICFPWDHSSIMTECFWLFQAHPPTSAQIVLQISKHCHFLTPPTHLFADVILEWSSWKASCLAQVHLTDCLEVETTFLTKYTTQYVLVSCTQSDLPIWMQQVTCIQKRDAAATAGDAIGELPACLPTYFIASYNSIAFQQGT